MSPLLHNQRPVDYFQFKNLIRPNDSNMVYIFTSQMYFFFLIHTSCQLNSRIDSIKASTNKCWPLFSDACGACTRDKIKQISALLSARLWSTRFVLLLANRRVFWSGYGSTEEPMQGVGGTAACHGAKTTKTDCNWCPSAIIEHEISFNLMSLRFLRDRLELVTRVGW